MNDDNLQIGELELHSRVLLGSARYPSNQVMLDCLAASRTEMVTVALRRVSPGAEGESLYELLRRAGVHVLPNTAGCYTAKDAVLTAQLGREAIGTELVKLEVIADDQTLLPDAAGLLQAADDLVRDGFVVLPYTNDDPVLALRLEDIGCAAVMPLAAPIGSGLGVRNPHNLSLIKERAGVPVIVDAGLGTASDVAIVFELGCDAVLVNSAVARAGDPVLMAQAVQSAAAAGRDAFRARRMPQKHHAEPSTPLKGTPWQ